MSLTKYSELRESIETESGMTLPTSEEVLDTYFHKPEYVFIGGYKKWVGPTIDIVCDMNGERRVVPFAIISHPTGSDVMLEKPGRVKMDGFETANIELEAERKVPYAPARFDDMNLIDGTNTSSMIQQTQVLSIATQDSESIDGSQSDDAIEVPDHVPKIDYVKLILQAQQRDTMTLTILRLMKDSDNQELLRKLDLTHRRFYIKFASHLKLSDEGILYVGKNKRNLIVVPYAFQLYITTLLHDSFDHPGRTKLMELIAHRFTWPKMNRTVEVVCELCLQCQKGKPPPKKNTFPMRPIITTKPFQVVQFDHCKLPMTKRGNKGILVLVDHFSKWIVVVPYKRHTAQETAQHIFRHWICRFGVPTRCIQSDNGPQFRAEVIKDLMELMRTQHKFSAPYHPRCNGLVERSNQTLIKALRTTCGDFAADWDKHLDAVTLSYNSLMHESTGFSPFKCYTDGKSACH